jgi:hypothetical protein
MSTSCSRKPDPTGRQPQINPTEGGSIELPPFFIFQFGASSFETARSLSSGRAFARTRWHRLENHEAMGCAAMNRPEYAFRIGDPCGDRRLAAKPALPAASFWESS